MVDLFGQAVEPVDLVTKGFHGFDFKQELLPALD